MTDRTPHPAFAAALPEHRWNSGTLRELWRVLNDEAPRRRQLDAGRILFSGAHVKLRIIGGVRELEIYRREGFKTAKGEAAWAAELMTFRRNFMVEDWTLELGETDEGGPRAIMRERTKATELFERAG